MILSLKNYWKLIIKKIWNYKKIVSEVEIIKIEIICEGRPEGNIILDFVNYPISLLSII